MGDTAELEDELENVRRCASREMVDRSDPQRPRPAQHPQPTRTSDNTASPGLGLGLRDGLVWRSSVFTVRRARVVVTG